MKPALIPLTLLLIAGTAAMLPLRTSGSQVATPCNCAQMQCEDFTKAVKTPVKLVGTLAVAHGQDANGKPYNPYLLKLRTPLCVAADVSDPASPEGHAVGPLTQVQLAGSRLSSVFIKANMGQPVEVSATLFGASSAYHLTPALADVQRMLPTI